jgi:hypothetical protein
MSRSNLGAPCLGKSSSSNALSDIEVFVKHTKLELD